MSKKKSHSGKTGLVFEELEPRLLLSADPLAVATDASVAVVQEHVMGNNEDTAAMVQASVEQSDGTVRNELVIIDSRAPNFQQLHNDLINSQQQGRNVHVVILDAHRDGIEQINEALSSHNSLDAVHIVSHGDDGQLQLGATQLNKATLRERSSDIAEWRQGFGENGDLLIYGCDLASTADGRLLVNAIGYLTATDVAASDDLTGSKLLGGDWELEYEAGDIETSVAFSEDVQQNWQGTLEGAAPAEATQEEQAGAEEQQQEQQAQAELIEQQTTRSQEDQDTAPERTEEQEQQAAIEQEQRLEIVFIDESVTDFQTFVDDLQGKSDDATRFEIYTLDGRSDGVEYIEAVLAEHDSVDALHIYSHGDDAAVKLGSTWLNPNTLEAYYDSLMAWGSGLDADADIMIYGCNLAESSDGEQFVSELAILTGADVAASNDNTGHSSLSGDWELEYRHGTIETTVATSDDVQNSWTNVLAVFTVDTNADTADASLGDGLAQDASGNTSLRAAIEEANALGGAHTIMLVADTYTLSTGELLITSDITITGAGADQTFIDGNFLSRVLHTQGGATVTITDVTIRNGDASGGGNGGALWIDDATDNVTLERVRLTGNTADTGGAIYNQGGTLTMTDVEISGNTASGGGKTGGGLDNEGTATLERVTVSGNTAGTGLGGGIYNSSALTMTNVTISGNSATNGGGLYTNNTALLTNVTITANSNGNATGGSGIHRGGGAGSVDLRNTIVAGNTGSPDLLGNINSLGNSLIGDSGGIAGFTDGVNGDQVGSTASPIDPLLDPLTDNGGFAPTHALQTGSTAIDAGTATGAPTTDQRGTLRDDGSVDIGAYEYNSLGTPSIGNSSSAGTGTLTTDTSLTWSHTVNPGSYGILIVSVAMHDDTNTNNVSSVTYGGTPLTLVDADASSKTRAEMWYLLAPTTGTADIVVTLSGATNFTAGATNFYGVDQSTPFGPVTTGNGSGDPSVAVASATGELVVDVIADRDIDPGGVTVGADQTTLWVHENGTDSKDATGASSYESGAASVTMDWTTVGAGAGEWAAVAISLKPTPNVDPVIASDGGGATAAVIVAENTTTVTTVTATDADLDTLTYSISGGADAALFSIDGSTGVLSFKGTPDFETPTDAGANNVYEVTVQVDDGNGGTDTQAISVTVTNIDPTAVNNSYTIDEDSTLTVDWWDSDWSHRQQLTFDNSAQSETLTDFPVLIVLNAGNIDYTQTNDDGSDLRFFAADGTELAYEIEQWNEGGDSSVWVRVPQITAGSSTDSIWMYYGNASAESGENPAGVWDSNFVGVWHLNAEQAGTGGTDVYKDSTAYGNDGIDRVAARTREVVTTL